MKFKTKIAVLVLGLIFLVSCGGGYNTHRDEKNGFQIDYPADWKDTAAADAALNFVVIEDFVGEDDLFGEQVNISIFPHHGSSLEGIVDQNIAMANQVYGSLKIDRKTGENQHGISYVQLKMPYTAENIDLVNRATFIKNENFLYTITQIAEADRLSTYDPVFDYMIDSFNWLEK